VTRCDALHNLKMKKFLKTGVTLVTFSTNRTRTLIVYLLLLQKVCIKV